MSYFVGIHSISQLKKEYRRLASTYHPDKGGDSRQMQEINAYYEHVLRRLKIIQRVTRRRQAATVVEAEPPQHNSRYQEPEYDKSRVEEPVYQGESTKVEEKTAYDNSAGQSSWAVDFRHVRVGETLYVNGTECEVLCVKTDSFRIVAKGRARQAIFSKEGGRGKYNPRLHASYDNRHKKHTTQV
ncbi:hypothetical protein A9Q99_08095 [Gammaproteobacteria bacterium 45_16_T64]|nr:hypothetical protein A9Q99_08095 [Gammaproteobacteria bacterium 45_16_T64]